MMINFWKNQIIRRIKFYDIPIIIDKIDKFWLMLLMFNERHAKLLLSITDLLNIGVMVMYQSYIWLWEYP